MATPQRLRHHAGALRVVEWHAHNDRLLSDIGGTVRIAPLKVTHTYRSAGIGSGRQPCG